MSEGLVLGMRISSQPGKPGFQTSLMSFIGVPFNSQAASFGSIQGYEVEPLSKDRYITPQFSYNY